MQTYKKAIFFLLLATVLLSVSQAFTAPVSAEPPHSKSKYASHDYCKHYLNIADPAQAVTYDELLYHRVANTDPSLCVP